MPSNETRDHILSKIGIGFDTGCDIGSHFVTVFPIRTWNISILHTFLGKLAHVHQGGWHLHSAHVQVFQATFDDASNMAVLLLMNSSIRLGVNVSNYYYVYVGMNS
jgi:hypothetical protein